MVVFYITILCWVQSETVCKKLTVCDTARPSSLAVSKLSRLWELSLCTLDSALLWVSLKRGPRGCVRMGKNFLSDDTEKERVMIHMCIYIHYLYTYVYMYIYVCIYVNMYVFIYILFIYICTYGHCGDISNGHCGDISVWLVICLWWHEWWNLPKPSRRLIWGA